MLVHNRLLIVLTLVALLMASCGGQDDGSPDGAAADPAAEDDGDEEAAEPEEPEEMEEEQPDDPADADAEGSRRIIIGETGGMSFSRLPAAVTRDRLNEEGWEIETVHFSAEDLQVEAVASGTVHMARLQALDAIRIIQLGGDIINIASDRPDEFVAIAPADVDDCSEMEGQRVAIHSEGSTYTHIYNHWLREVCGVENVERLVVSGGENRVIALLNGEIDGTNVQMADFVNLDEQAPGEYQILANFGQEIQGLVGGMVLVNRTWLDSNRDLATEYLTELFQDLHDANADGSAMRAAAEAYQSPEDVAAFDTVREVYIRDLGGFPECGLVDRETVEALTELFVELDMIEPGLTPEEVVDFDILEAAREAADHC